MNYFELFQLPVSLHVDAQQLKEKFYFLSRKYHPDFYTQEDETGQVNSLEKSALVNKAYKTFQSPAETIKYVLRLKGLIEEEEKYQLQPDFLMNMMDINERLEDAKTDGDKTLISDLRNELIAKEVEIYIPVKSIIEDDKDAINDHEKLLKVKDYYFKKKYLERILAAI